MRIVLFCENKYAIDILMPLQEEARREGGHEVLWYVHKKRIPDFPLKDQVSWTNSMQETYDFRPEAIFVPGNIVPYYLPGVKIEVFHGYAAEKKDHWVIRRYIDTYFTQGPFFTRGFEQLAKKYNDFEVLETGWPRQDWIFHNLHTFDPEREQLLRQSGKKRIVLYAPTFSPSLTSMPYMKEALVQLAEERDALVLIKFHPLAAQQYIDEYTQLAKDFRFFCGAPGPDGRDVFKQKFGIMKSDKDNFVCWADREKVREADKNAVKQLEEAQDKLFGTSLKKLMHKVRKGKASSLDVNER